MLKQIRIPTIVNNPVHLNDLNGLLILGQLTPRKNCPPNPKTNANLNPNLNPSQWAVFRAIFLEEKI